MAKLQAEKWEDLKPDVAALTKALEAFHTPPEPDDNFAQYMHKTLQGAQGLHQFIQTKSEQEEEAEMFNNE